MIAPFTHTPLRIADLVLYRLEAGNYRLTAPEGSRSTLRYASLLLAESAGCRLSNDDGSVSTWLPTNTPCLTAHHVSQRIAIAEPIWVLRLPTFRLSGCPLSLPMIAMAQEMQVLLFSIPAILADAAHLPPVGQRHAALAIESLLHPLVHNRPSSDSAEIISVIMRAERKTDADAVSTAKALGMSRSRLYETLRPYGGFHTLLNAARLDRMARRLLMPEYAEHSVKELLHDMPFERADQFHRLFKQRYANTASQWRSDPLPTLPATIDPMPL
ncbi:AraC family transcriptional regulator [Halomonas faecis]|uniref:AraC family transcriptional regulator n=1 Tax=Halomonas faecis TaxID=1562110 RepID=UPI0013D03B34|nr:helix-turn-helix domain-containing protein [Halomonas faecis]